MESFENHNQNPLEFDLGECSNAIEAFVPDDTVEKVGPTPIQADPTEPNVMCDELTNSNSLENDAEIDVEQGFDTIAFGDLSKQDTLEFFDENKEIDEEDNEEKEEKEPLSYELEQGNRILKEVMSEANKSVNWAFMDSVDADKMGLYDYYERIKNPMWLKKMKEKFDDRMYSTVTEFAADFRLMLENCYRYNGPDHYISKRGQRLETMFEQKLSLLSRELREKTSIAATTGQNMEERVISGTRRRKVLVPHDSTALLNQLRLEEKEREREQRRQQMIGKQKEREEFEQTLQSWEDELLEQPMKDYMQTMWEIPAIGHFLFLCAAPLNLGEIMHWELERCFAMPRESLTMQTVMTSLLSTPYQRTNLDKKPLMPYRVWEEKLRVRARQWYKVYKDNNRDITKTLNKSGLEEKFFKAVGHKNPLEKKKYHELTFFQRVWIMKGLCDSCMETQESLREAIEAQPVTEQRSYELGCDADGNTYLHFPQFCGQDVRVYRQAPIKMPKLDKPPKMPKQKYSITLTPPPPMVSPKKKKGTRKKKKKKKEETTCSSPTPRSRHSRLRQNPKQIAASLGLSDTETSMQTSDSGISENEEGGPAAKKRNVRYRKPFAFENSDNDSREATPISFFRSRFASLERIKDTPSRESTPAPSPIPSRLTRTQQIKDDSSRASTPCSEISSPSKLTSAKKGKGKRRKGRKGLKNTYRKVNLDEEESNSNLPDANGSIASNDPSTDINESTLMEVGDAKEDDVGKSEASPVPMATGEDDNSDITETSGTQDKVDEKAENTGCSDAKESKSDGETKIQDEEKCSINEEFRSETPVDAKNSSQDDDCVKSDKSSSSPSPTDCDKSESQCENSGEVNKESMPFQSYGKENGEVTAENGASSNESIEDCHPSTSSLGVDSKPTVKEESNDSATTSPYSVSDMSADEMETNNKTNIETYDIKSDVKLEKDEIKTEESGNPNDEFKQEIKEESENKEPVNGDGETKVKAENEEKPDVSEEDMKKEMEEEKAEESEEKEPEVTEPEPGDFELVVSTIDDLRDLIQKFAEPEPIIEKKGKKEKVIQPPPRKRCEKELHDRLAYLLSELEPWEPKLLQANKRAKIRLRKEHESYVEEPEPKDDVWSSEEEIEESSEDSDDSSDSNSRGKNEESRLKRSLRKRVMTEVEKESMNAELPEELGISSRGRIRKRRIIPNNIEDQGLRKRRKEPDHSPSPTPNILQRSKSPASAATVVTTTAAQPPQYKTVLNQLQLPANLNASKGGFQLLSINNQMVLVSTGPQKDKNGNPVATTQPTVLAHISGSSQPVALPLSIVTALQAQAKQQQTQQQQPSGSSSSSVTQQALKTFITNKTTVSGGVSNATQQTPSQTVLRSVVDTANGVTKATSSVPISTTQSSVPVQVAATSGQQSANKTLDPKLLQQVLQQQGKIKVGVASTTAPAVVAAVPTGVTNPVRPQFYHYNNIAKLPPNVIQQLIKTNSPQQIVKVRPPAEGSATVVNTLKNAVTAEPTGNVEGSTPQALAESTALTNLVQAGLMPQAPKVTSFVASPPGNATPHQTNLTQNETNAKLPQMINTSTAGVIGAQKGSATTTPPTNIVTVSMSPSGLITSTPNKASQETKINQELIAKLEAQGVPVGKQPNIAAMIQANPGLFKSLSSPPKQKYASNVTVKSLLEKRALDNLRQKQTDGSNGKDESTLNGNDNTPGATEVQGTKVSVPETSQVATLTKVSPVPLKSAVNLPTGVRLQSPPQVSTVPVAQVMQGGAIRKIQLTSQKPAEQGQVRAQIVQQPSANIQTVTVSPSSNVLNVQQNLTPQQLQLLQQQLVAKFGAQNIPQNIQIVQQVPVQQAVTPSLSTQLVASPQVAASNQIKVPTGAVTIQPKVLTVGSKTVQRAVLQDETFRNESVIDSALKTVMTTVQTSLPTAQIKVNSPFATTTRNVTITTSAMKSPIPAVPPVEAMSSLHTKTVPVNVLNNGSSIVTPTIGASSVASQPPNIINASGANIIKIIPDASNKAGNVQVPGLAAHKNVVVQMKQMGAQNIVVTQGTIQQLTGGIAMAKPSNVSGVKQPQTVHNLLLQQKKATGNIKLVPVSEAMAKGLSNASSTVSSSIISTNAGAVHGNTAVNLATVQLTKGGGKIPLSPKTKISSVPYVKPQTIQQLIESKAKASNVNKTPVVVSPHNKQTVVTAETLPGAPVRVVQGSAAVASLPQPVASTVSPVPANNTTQNMGAAGATMTNIMANVGGKMVQLRVAVAPGQNINQILQSPQLQQQLQQLQQSALVTAGVKATATQVVASLQQPQPTVQTVPQDTKNINVIKTGSKTIRALTNMNSSQQQTSVNPVLQTGVIRPVLNTKVPTTPHVLSAKAAAPRATLVGNQTLLTTSAVSMVEPQHTTLLSTEASSVATVGQQVAAPTANVAQGKVMLVNVGGQIMAAQNIGGRTVLTPQGVSVVGQNVAAVSQNVPAQIITNTQPKLIAAPQAVGTVGVQPVQLQAAVMNGQNSVPMSQNNLVQANLVNNTAVSNVNMSLQNPVSVAAPLGGLMMVGSGLMPVPTTQLTTVSTTVNPGSLMQVNQAPQTQTFRHSMPQQIQLSRQSLTMATPQLAAAPQASPPRSASGGLEQLALAAAQVQEAMQHQQTGAPVKSGAIVNQGSNPPNASNIAQNGNAFTTLPNGAPLP